MSAGFTPGPWTVSVGEPAFNWTEWPSGKKWKSGGVEIAPIGVRLAWSERAEGDKDRSIATAHLIAAAPDLYEAAADALAGWRYIRALHGDLLGVGWDRVEAALTNALAKARGGS